MAHINDYLIDLVKNSWVEDAGTGADNTALTQTHAAEAVRHHVVAKVDASYEVSTSSGLLQVKFGTVVVASKFIHGAGAIDFGVLGFQNPTVNQLVEAVLAAPGDAGVAGTLVLTGYTTGPDA